MRHASHVPLTYTRITLHTHHTHHTSHTQVLPELKLDVASLGVDVDNNFEPIYVQMQGKGEVVKRLKALAKKSSRVLLATDEDREGEAISWHLLEILQPSVPVKRAVFHEITQSAILEAFESPRDIDMDLVQSQETRRILDRLTGYTISPILWRYVHTIHIPSMHMPSMHISSNSGTRQF